jgi:hypothetical protein
VTHCDTLTLLWHRKSSNSLDPIKTAEGTVGAPTCLKSKCCRSGLQHLLSYFRYIAESTLCPQSLSTCSVLCFEVKKAKPANSTMYAICKTITNSRQISLKMGNSCQCVMPASKAAILPDWTLRPNIVLHLFQLVNQARDYIIVDLWLKLRHLYCRTFFQVLNQDQTSTVVVSRIFGLESEDSSLLAIFEGERKDSSL